MNEMTPVSNFRFLSSPYNKSLVFVSSRGSPCSIIITARSSCKTWYKFFAEIRIKNIQNFIGHKGHIWPYRTISEDQEICRTLLKTVKDHTQLYSNMLDYIEMFKTIQDVTRLYSTQYRTIQDNTGNKLKKFYSLTIYKFNTQLTTMPSGTNNLTIYNLIIK